MTGGLVIGSIACVFSSLIVGNGRAQDVSWLCFEAVSLHASISSSITAVTYRSLDSSGMGSRSPAEYPGVIGVFDFVMCKVSRMNSSEGQTVGFTRFGRDLNEIDFPLLFSLSLFGHHSAFLLGSECLLLLFSFAVDHISSYI